MSTSYNYWENYFTKVYKINTTEQFTNNVPYSIIEFTGGKMGGNWIRSNREKLQVSHMLKIGNDRLASSRIALVVDGIYVKMVKLDNSEARYYDGTVADFTTTNKWDTANQAPTRTDKTAIDPNPPHDYLNVPETIKNNYTYEPEYKVVTGTPYRGTMSGVWIGAPREIQYYATLPDNSVIVIIDDGTYVKMVKTDNSEAKYFSGPIYEFELNKWTQYNNAPTSTTAGTPNKYIYNPLRDCVVSNWSDWSSCSKTCGGGNKTRTRTVTTQPKNGGTVCPSLTENETCNTQPCSTDCVVSNWSDWSSCSKTCGGGERSRTRTVTTEPKDGGAECPELTENGKCNTEDCPMNPWYIIGPVIGVVVIVLGLLIVKKIRESSSD